MTDNMDFSKIQPLDHKDQFENVEKIHSLQKVSEEIQQTIDVVDSYKRQLESLQPPVVNGEPWYKFSFGKASDYFFTQIFKLSPLYQDADNIVVLEHFDAEQFSLLIIYFAMLMDF